MAQLTAPTKNRLILEARLLLNQPKEENSFWSDDELSAYIDDAIRMYFQEVTNRAEGQFDKVADLDIVENQELVTMPTDVFDVRAIYKKNSNGYRMLTYWNNLTEGFETDSNQSGDTYDGYYYFRQNDLVLRPIPSFSETGGLRVEYSAFPETMIFGGDVMTSNVQPIFKELIVLYVVYKAKVKESLTTGNTTYAAVKQMLDESMVRFKDTIGYRSKNPQFIIPFTP